METIMISWSHPQRSLALRGAFFVAQMARSWRECGAFAWRFYGRIRP